MTHTISLRISQLIWRHPQRWAELLGILQEYREVISEVAYFTGFTHPPRPLAEIQDTARKLQEEMLPAAKALGLRAGINHLATLGHLDENAENSLQEPWQHLVDLDGSVSRTCYCAADPQVLDYVRQAYIALAGAGPDFLWVDDDIRMEHHPRRSNMAASAPPAWRLSP